MSDTSFVFLLFGSLTAVGLALAVGTLAALWRYHRTGMFPGGEQGEGMSRGQLAGLWVRVGLGVLVTGIGIVAIQRAGIVV